MISLACIFVKLIKIIFYLIVRRINSILGSIKLEIKKLQIIIPFRQKFFVLNDISRIRVKN